MEKNMWKVPSIPLQFNYIDDRKINAISQIKNVELEISGSG
jgi:hypothetical protein